MSVRTSSFQSDAQRIAILYSFVLTVLLALPIWWKTTSIERLSLPRTELTEWSQASCAFPLPIQLRISLDDGLHDDLVKGKSDDVVGSAWESVTLLNDLASTSTALLNQRAAQLNLRPGCLQFHVSAHETEQYAKASSIIDHDYVGRLGRWHADRQGQDEIQDAPPVRPQLTDLAPRASMLSYSVYLHSGDDRTPTLRSANIIIAIPDRQSSCADLAERFVEEVLQQFPLEALAGGPYPAGAAGGKAIQYQNDVELVFSLVHEDASDGGAYSSWDIEQILSSGPIAETLTTLSRLHNFRVETQMLFYAPLAFQPHFEAFSTPVTQFVKVEREVEVPDDEVLYASEEGEVQGFRKEMRSFMEEVTTTHYSESHVIELEDLKIFVNAGEWSLGTSSPQEKGETIHLLLYVPSKAHAPLRIRDPATRNLSESRSWVVPQWGGVMLVDRPSKRTLEGQKNIESSLPSDVLQEALAKWNKHLHILLGVPGEVGKISPLQVDLLSIARMLENLAETVDTLNSIVSLVDKLEKLGVDRAVRADFIQSIASLRAMTAMPPLPLPDLLALSTRASTHASRSFFNPSMIAQLYFPDEHKYAVYTPLFGPISVPLLVAIIKEIKRRRDVTKVPSERKRQ